MTRSRRAIVFHRVPNMSTTDASPPISPLPRPLERADELLLEYLREHSVACPICGYDLRALTQPTCPECRHELRLTVGATSPRFGWLLAAVAPGFFSGIAAIFLLLPIVGQLYAMGRLEPLVVAVELFGLSSGIFAVYVGIRRLRFIAQPPAKQRMWAILIWLVHITVLVLLIAVVLLA